MNKTQSISVGIFVVLGIALLWVIQNSLNDASTQKAPGYEIVGYFDTLLQLRSGDDVRMAGVRIGRVQSTELDGTRAKATFRIDQQYRIPEDSEASIGMAGLLGANLVSIKIGSSPYVLSNGKEIRTVAGFDINLVVNEIGALSNRVGNAFASVEKLLGTDEEGKENIFDLISRLLSENRDSIRNTLANLDTISGQIAAGEGTIGKLVMEDAVYEDIRTVTAELKQTLAEAETLISNTRSIIDHVKSGQGTVGTLIYGETDIAAQLEALMKDLREFSAKLNNPDSTIGKLLTDDQLYGEVQTLMKKASQTLDGMGDAAPISAIGAAAGALF